MKAVKLKKQISFSKYQRIRASTESIPVRSFRLMKTRYEPELALEAYKCGDYVYAIFRCKKQNGNRLSTYCTRYWVGDCERSDLFAYAVDTFRGF